MSTWYETKREYRVRYELKYGTIATAELSFATEREADDYATGWLGYGREDSPIAAYTVVVTIERERRP